MLHMYMYIRRQDGKHIYMYIHTITEKSMCHRQSIYSCKLNIIVISQCSQSNTSQTSTLTKPTALRTSTSG